MVITRLSLPTGMTAVLDFEPCPEVATQVVNRTGSTASWDLVPAAHSRF